MKKYLGKQDQHIIPRVYLRQFGYTYKNKWYVSVFTSGENVTKQRSIKSFTARTNYFDIDSEDKRIIRIYEELNGEIESVYPSIIKEISSSNEISIKSKSYLLQMIGNLICRSAVWRNSVREVLDGQNRSCFTKILLIHNDSDKSQRFQSIENDGYFIFLMSLSPDEAMNRIMLLYTDFLVKRISYFSVVIMNAEPDKGWWTTDNPVVIDRNLPPKKNSLFCENSNIFFPISKDYLAFLHLKSASQIHYPSFVQLKENEAHNIKTVMFDHITRKILKNLSEHKISPTKLDYDIEKNNTTENRVNAHHQY